MKHFTHIRLTILYKLSLLALFSAALSPQPCDVLTLDVGEAAAMNRLSVRLLRRFVGLEPQPLDFPRAPHKLFFGVVFEEGKPDELLALPFIEDGEHKVVEDAVSDMRKFSADQSLIQEEVNQGGLVVTVSQGSQALQDASDAQVVMGAAENTYVCIKKNDLEGLVIFLFSEGSRCALPVQVAEPLPPVVRSHHGSCPLVHQLNAIEVQHELVGLQKIFLCGSVLNKELKETKVTSLFFKSELALTLPFTSISSFVSVLASRFIPGSCSGNNLEEKPQLQMGSEGFYTAFVIGEERSSPLNVGVHGFQRVVLSVPFFMKIRDVETFITNRSKR